MKAALPGSRYEVVSPLPDSAYPFRFDPFLFLLPAHLALQPCPHQVTYYLLDHRERQVVAHFPFFLESGKALSPFRSTFGSAQFADGLPALVLQQFVAAVFAHLSAEGATEVQITHYPSAYAPGQTALLTHTFLEAGLQVLHTQLNHHIPVSAGRLSARLHPSALRRLAKCRRQGFGFQQQPPERLPEIHAFIKHCRDEKAQSLSLTLEQLEELFRLFPDRFLLFTVTDGPALAAATVAVRINSAVLYNFYPASPLAYNAFSPVVMLNDGLYDYCLRNGYRLLDLGISARPGEEHFPLIAFKEHLGAEASLKLTFAGALPAPAL